MIESTKKLIDQTLDSLIDQGVLNETDKDLFFQYIAFLYAKNDFADYYPQVISYKQLKRWIDEQ